MFSIRRCCSISVYTSCACSVGGQEEMWCHSVGGCIASVGGCRKLEYLPLSPQNLLPTSAMLYLPASLSGSSSGATSSHHKLCQFDFDAQQFVYISVKLGLFGNNGHLTLMYGFAIKNIFLQEIGFYDLICRLSNRCLVYIFEWNM